MGNAADQKKEKIKRTYDKRNSAAWILIICYLIGITSLIVYWMIHWFSK